MNKPLQNIRIARVSTIPFFILTQLRGQLDALVAAGADVSVISSSDELSGQLQAIEGCVFQPVQIAREIRLFADIITLIQLWRIFRKQRFDIIHSTTPKAGLLCAVAAKLAGIPLCIHTFTGQPWATMSGLKKILVKWSDKIIGRLNYCCYTDSFSQRDFLLANGIVAPARLKVLGSGSLAGVDIRRFCADNFSEVVIRELKATLKIAPASQVLLFVGRVTKEKGIFELIEAVHNVLKNAQDVVLVVVGPFEQHNEEDIRAYARQLCDDKVIFTGFQTEPERFMAISDLLCLPSYREGFGTVVIEAAAMALPVVGTKIYGLTDAVVDGETGILVEPANCNQLTEVLQQLLSDPQRIKQMGLRAKIRAIAEFDSIKLHALLINEYITLLSGGGDMASSRDVH